MSAALPEIEKAAKAFADAHSALRAECEELDAEIRAAKKARRSKLLALSIRAAAAKSNLADLVESAPDLFEKPKTMVLYDVKVGFQKMKGRIEIADPARTLALIRKHFSDQADMLIRTVESPNREALGELPVCDLKKIGAEITETCDKVIVKPVASDIDRLVEAFVAELEEIAS
jgi:hypothetical protein